MDSVSIRERFRPARVAIVIPDSDADAFEQAVRLNTALLGGMFNPIVPYSSERQNEAIQTLRLFNPDLIHTQGQVSLSWLPQDLTPKFPRQYSTLYFTGQNGTRYFLYQDVLPVIALMWREVARIEKPTPFFFPVPAQDSTYHLLFKALFGAFPDDFSVPYERYFRENLTPYHLTLTDNHPLQTADPWDRISPLRLTIYGLNQHSSNPNNLARVLFAGDPLELDSLIDFWNLRASGNEALFVLVHSFSGSEFHVRELFKTPNLSLPQPALNNICFSRSSSEDARRSFEEWFHGLFSENATEPTKSWVSADYWAACSRVNRYSYPDESETLAPISDGWFHYQTAFPEWLRPPRANRDERRIYVVPSFRGIYGSHDYLVDFPPDPGIEDLVRNWWAQNGRITDEGLLLLRSPRDRQIQIRLPSGEEAIEAIFFARRMRIRLSEPGNVTKQIIKRLGGIEGCRVFKVKAVRDTLGLLNDRKAHPLQEILRTIGKSLSQTAGGLFIDKRPIKDYRAGEVLALMHRLGMLQQGWRLQCGTCSMYDWYPVSDIGSEFECRWCFAKQLTPPLVNNSSVTFEYRASGLFLTHQKMKGSVPVITTLWRLVNRGGHFENSVFITSIEVEQSGDQRKVLGELDFVVLMPRPSGSAGYKLILGEARGAFNYEERDVQKVREIADRFGQEFVKKHVCLCFSTLKDTFSDSEKQVLGGLMKDGYEVIPLTRLDLDPYDLHERFKGMPNQYFQTLEQLAANTRQLNLQ